MFLLFSVFICRRELELRLISAYRVAGFAENSRSVSQKSNKLRLPFCTNVDSTHQVLVEPWHRALKPSLDQNKLIPVKATQCKKTVENVNECLSVMTSARPSTVCRVKQRGNPSLGYFDSVGKTPWPLANQVYGTRAKLDLFSNR